MSHFALVAALFVFFIACTPVHKAQEPSPRLPDASLSGNQEIAPTKEQLVREIGIPKIALRVNLKRLFRTPFVKRILSDNPETISTGLEGTDTAGILRCAGSSGARIYQVIDEAILFVGADSNSGVVIFNTTINAGKLLKCVMWHDKKARAVRFDGQAALKNSKGMLYTTLGKNRILALAGSFAGTVRPSTTSLRMGSANTWFPKRSSDVDIIFSRFPAQSLGPLFARLVSPARVLSGRVWINLSRRLVLGGEIEGPNEAVALRIARDARELLKNPNLLRTFRKLGLGGSFSRGFDFNATGSRVRISGRIGATALGTIARLANPKKSDPH